MPFVLRKLGCCVPSRLDKAPRLVFILIQYLSNSTKQQIHWDGDAIYSRLKIKNADVFKMFRHPKNNAISCAPAASRVLSVCAHFSNCG